jgi:hypothetical protein
MVNDMDHEPQEAVHEIFPRARLAIQATLQELSVNVRKSHGRLPFRSSASPDPYSIAPQSSRE